VVSNLKSAIKRKGNCTIGAQMILLPENQDEVEKFKALGEEIGLDYTVVKPYSQHKSSLTNQYEKFIPIVPASEGKMIVRQNAIETKEIPYKKCHATPYLWAYIMANGDVYSCSAYLLDERFKLGNINEQTFKEIWQGEKRRENWELMKTLDIKECRVNCRMNQSNIYLNNLIEGIEHVNFI
jgi:radical SAM protein with 4Fe4S-binding SPASM domain